MYEKQIRLTYWLQATSLAGIAVAVLAIYFTIAFDAGRWQIAVNSFTIGALAWCFVRQMQIRAGWRRLRDTPRF